MHRPVWLVHRSFIEESHMTKNMVSDDITTQHKQGREERKTKVYLFYFSMMLIHFFKVKIFKDREDGSLVGN